MKEMAKALIEARSHMGKLIKDKQNPHFRSKYATLKAVIETAQGPLAEAGICVLEYITSEGEIPLQHLDMIHAESGDQLTSEMPLNVRDPQNPQQVGSAQTYARRYLWTAAAGLAPEDDDGNAASQAKAPQKAAQAKPNQDAEDPELEEKRAYWSELCMKMKELGKKDFPSQMEWIKNQKGFKTISEPGKITCKQYPKLIKLAEDENEDLPFADETTEKE